MITTVYHASNHIFSKPDICEIHKNRVNHNNGMLGLFFSVENNKWFHTFGEHIYSIDIPSSFNGVKMPLEEFKKLSIPKIDESLLIDYFINTRNDFINKGVDYILITEYDETSQMGVFINLDIECVKIN